MFPVKQRAHRMSVSLASVPPLVNNDSVSGPPGVSDAIFFAIAAYGSVANKVETRWSVSSCRSTFAFFVIRAADAHCV